MVQVENSNLGWLRFKGLITNAMDAVDAPAVPVLVVVPPLAGHVGGEEEDGHQPQ